MDSRAKGARGELKARDLCRDFWYASDCERAGQTSGNVCADLMGALPRSHPEVKYLAKHACMRHHEQAVEDAKKGELPLLLLRETNTGNQTWLVAFDAERAEDFVSRFLRAMHLSSPDLAERFSNDARYGN